MRRQHVVAQPICPCVHQSRLHRLLPLLYLCLARRFVPRPGGELAFLAAVAPAGSSPTPARPSGRSGCTSCRGAASGRVGAAQRSTAGFNLVTDYRRQGRQPASVTFNPLAWPHVGGQSLRFMADGIKYLGAPYYSHHPQGVEFGRSFFSGALESISFDLDCIRRAVLRSRGHNPLLPRHAWLLITRCVQARWQHMLRSCRLDSRLSEACAEFDNRLCGAVVHTLTGVSLRQLLDGQPQSLASLVHTQIRLPVRLSGIGLRCSVHLAIAAALAVDVSLTQEACKHLAIHRGGNPSRDRYASGSFLAEAFGDLLAWLRRRPRLSPLHRISSVQALVDRLAPRDAGDSNQTPNHLQLRHHCF